MLQFAKRQPAGNIEQTLTVMSEVWDGKPLAADADEVRLSGGDSDGQYLIRVPHLTLLAALALMISSPWRSSCPRWGAERWSRFNTGCWMARSSRRLIPMIWPPGPLPATLIDALRAIATPPDSGNLVNIALPDQIPGRRVATSVRPSSPISSRSPPCRSMPNPAPGIFRPVDRPTRSHGAGVLRGSGRPTVTPELLRHAVDGEARRLRRLLDRFSVLSSDDGKLSAYEKVLDFITSKRPMARAIASAAIPQAPSKPRR